MVLFHYITGILWHIVSVKIRIIDVQLFNICHMAFNQRKFGEIKSLPRSEKCIFLAEKLARAVGSCCFSHQPKKIHFSERGPCHQMATHCYLYCSCNETLLSNVKQSDENPSPWSVNLLEPQEEETPQLPTAAEWKLSQENQAALERRIMELEAKPGPRWKPFYRLLWLVRRCTKYD